jgi:hypothetical protein
MPDRRRLLRHWNSQAGEALPSRPSDCSSCLGGISPELTGPGPGPVAMPEDTPGAPTRSSILPGGKGGLVRSKSGIPNGGPSVRSVHVVGQVTSVVVRTAPSIR